MDKQASQTEVNKSHVVTLSNGNKVILEERDDSLHIGLADSYGGVDAYICTIEPGGVLVMPNSGDATQCLVEGLGSK